MWYMRLLEKNMFPDWLLRRAVQGFLVRAARQREALDVDARQAGVQALVARLKKSPIAINTSDANEQHYEVPTEFFEIVLGKRLKYSACYWPEGVQEIDAAEDAMLRLTCERARVQDGMQILDLGCGWGSLCLWLCEQYPNSRVVAVSNSHTQRAYIEQQAQQRGFSNLEVITSDMNLFDTSRRFDRVLSIEMFEHMKNYQLLMARIASWLKPDGLLFVHIFSNREFASELDTGQTDHSDRADNWMARYFFTGGNMPSDDLLLYFQQDMKILDHWKINGQHYGRTLNAWLRKMDQNEAQIRPILARAYGKKQTTRWWTYWRLFFLSCAETFNFRHGQEFIVSHYLFARR
ncbi:MAG: SAM-dependent methyltransferase [Ardenticatenaceae bacterium]